MKDEILGLSCGAYFCRADLHIHSYGGSHDVKDKTCTAAGIVAEAKKERLDIIAIADHNAINNIAGSGRRRHGRGHHARACGRTLDPRVTCCATCPRRTRSSASIASSRLGSRTPRTPPG
jgi:hypothetical protein